MAGAFAAGSVVTAAFIGGCVLVNKCRQERQKRTPRRLDVNQPTTARRRLGPSLSSYDSDETARARIRMQSTSSDATTRSDISTNPMYGITGPLPSIDEIDVPIYDTAVGATPPAPRTLRARPQLPLPPLPDKDAPEIDAYMEMASVRERSSDLAVERENSTYISIYNTPRSVSTSSDS